MHQTSSIGSDLRKRAEALLQADPEKTPVVRTADVQRLLHELHVYQVELDLQNEELRQTQLALADSRDRFAELYDFCPVAYLTMDREAWIRESNFAASTLLGVERQRLIGRRQFGSFVSPNAQDDWYRHWRLVQSAPERRSVELSVRTQEGQARILHLHSVPRPDEHPDDWRCLVALVDVTDRKALEKDLDRMNRDLEERVSQRTAELGSMLGYANEQRQELQRLAAELSIASELERQRIASELHDGLCQLLTSGVIVLDGIAQSTLPRPAKAAVAKAIGTLERALRETRKLTFDLTCPTLDTLGLPAAVEQLCGEYSRCCGIQFCFEGSKDPVPLSHHRQVILFRAVRELLMNAVRHAQAGQVRVAVQRLPGTLRIRVEDDGIGFAPSEEGTAFTASGGFGLFSVRENLESMGGRLQIESNPGIGCRVSLELPWEEGSNPP